MSNLTNWYMKGYNDELNGTSSLESDDIMENRAYKVGAIDAEFGDTHKYVMAKTENDIIYSIKYTKNWI